MKNFFTLLLFCCLFLSCTSDSDEAIFENDKVATAAATTTSSAFANNPEANSAYDNSYKGIYKGVIIGNVSGALYVNIQNDGEIWAKFQTDEQKSYVLENVSIVDAQDKNVASAFKLYRFANPNMSFELKLDENGSNITTSNLLFFSTSNSKICLLKEKSNSLLKCYAGQFRRQNESGKINFITDGLLKVSGLSKKSNSIQTTNISGEINLISTGNEATRIGDGSDNDLPTQYYKLSANLHIGEIIGYLKRNKFEGYWTYEGSEIGSWNARRVL